MPVSLPTMPTMPKDPGAGNPQDPAFAKKVREYDQAMLAYQDQMARYNRMMQNLQQQQNEEQATRSNMAKSRHEAMMSIVGNLKA